MNIRHSIVITLFVIAFFLFLTPVIANAESEELQNIEMQVKIINGIIESKVDIELNVGNLNEFQGQNINLFYALYKENRMIDIVTKNILVYGGGFSDKEIIIFSRDNKPDTCKAFLLSHDSFKPIITNIMQTSEKGDFIEEDPFSVLFPNNNQEFSFTGINVLFNRNIEVPTTGEGFHIYDGETEIEITDIGFTMNPAELQINSEHILPDKTYTLKIDANTIKDLEGNFYPEEIVLDFIYRLSFRILLPENNSIFSYPGINVVFSRDIEEPTTFDGIHIYDGETEVEITDIGLSMYPSELQVYSEHILPDKTYTLKIDANTIKDLGGNYYPEEIVLDFKYVSFKLLDGIQGYVLDTENGGVNHNGNAPLIKILLANGITRVFETNRYCHQNSGGDILLEDGKWNLSTGDVIVFSTDGDGAINEIEKKRISATNINRNLTKHGYFDGYEVSKDAFIVLYDNKFSTRGSDYKVVPLNSVLDTLATGVDYSVHNAIVDFMLIKYIPAESVQLDSSAVTMEAGSSFQLNGEVSPDSANIQGLEWESSDGSIATVEEGLIRAVKFGSVVVTAISTDTGAFAQCNVTVTESVSNITLDKTELSLFEGGEEKLFYSTSPAGFSSQINWYSSDEWVAEVSDEGVVTAIFAGTVIITAQLENGKKAAFCTVTVKSTTIYGVITGIVRTDSTSGYEIEAIIDGKMHSYESVKLTDIDMNELYKLNLDNFGVVVSVERINPDISTLGSDIISISNGILKYGAHVKTITLDRDVVVYVLGSNGRYEVGSISDVISHTGQVDIYDIDEWDRIYDVVLLR